MSPSEARADLLLATADRAVLDCPSSEKDCSSHAVAVIDLPTSVALKDKSAICTDPSFVLTNSSKMPPAEVDSV